jgi:hypothetical protein
MTPLVTFGSALVVFGLFSLIILVASWKRRPKTEPMMKPKATPKAPKKPSGFSLFSRKKKPQRTMSSARVPQTIPTGKTVKVRMTDVVDDKGRKKRVIASTLNVQLKDTIRRRGKRFFAARTGIPGLEWGAYHLDMKEQDANGELTFDRAYCEPIRPKDGIAHRSFEVSIVMANAFVVQGIEIATILSSFVFTKRHLVIIAVSITLAALFVGSLNPIIHFVPNTEIHYVPSLPRQAP